MSQIRHSHLCWHDLYIWAVKEKVHAKTKCTCAGSPVAKRWWVLSKRTLTQVSKPVRFSTEPQTDKQTIRQNLHNLGLGLSTARFSYSIPLADHLLQLCECILVCSWSCPRFPTLWTQPERWGGRKPWQRWTSTRTTSSTCDTWNHFVPRLEPIHQIRPQPSWLLKFVKSHNESFLAEIS